MAGGRRPEVGDLYAVGAGGDELEIFLDVGRIGKPSVVADAKTEVRFGCWNWSRLRLLRRERERQQEQTENEAAWAHEAS